MLCGLGLHRAELAAVWNGGIGFSRCRHCRAELVRRAGAPWTTVPRGYAVVWRPADGEAEEEIALLRPFARVRDTWCRLAARRVLPPASRDYRYLVQRVAAARAGGAPARTLLLSSHCRPEPANETLLLFAAMLQDEMGGRLLLVDATLGEEGVAAALRPGRRAGLSDARADDVAALRDSLLRVSDRPLFLLGPGRDPAGTRAAALAGVLPALAPDFDHIVVQQRAITTDTRNLVLARQADMALVLAEEGETAMAALDAAREAFHTNDIRPAGLVLTVPTHAA